MDTNDTPNEWAQKAVAAMLAQCIRTMESGLTLELQLVLAAKARLGL